MSESLEIVNERWHSARLLVASDSRKGSDWISMRTLRANSEQPMIESDAQMPIEVVKARVRESCEDRDWDRFHGAKDLAIGIATEAAELLERFRFLSDAEVEQALRDPASRQAIQDELADVLIFSLRFSQRFNFNLAGAVTEKLAANALHYPVDGARGSNRKADKAAQ